MKKTLFILLICMIQSIVCMAQDGMFKARVYNKDYDVFLDVNLYEESITIPGQELLGKVYGYIKKATDSRVWIIMEATLDEKARSARLVIVNDYGSEDLVAELTADDDGGYTLKQLEGSIIKMAGKGKWIKLPKIMTFKRK